MRDPYQVLGVGRQAGDGEIKAAYRKLAKELHPDLHPNDARMADRFKEVSAAYAVLGDPEQRARFDRGEIGPDGAERFAAGGRGGGARTGGFRWESGGAGGGRFSAEDLFGSFEDLFGQFSGQGARTRGADRSFRLNVDFVDAALGSTRRINLPNGRVVDVRIPAGIETGRTIRLKGQADPDGGPPGDVLIEVAVADHPHFRRDGRDIHLDLPVSLPEAVLGAKVSAPTIHGNVTVTVPAGANTGRTLRLRGKGVPAGDGKPDGDHYIHLRVVLPDPPDPELRSFLEKWAKKHDYDVRRKAGFV